MSLSPQQSRLLQQAILESFPDAFRLELVVRNWLGRNLQTIVAPTQPLDVQVFRLTETARAEGWLPQLVTELRNANPGNQKLFAVAQQLQLTATDLDRSGLESLISEAHGFLDVAVWRERLTRLESQVCRVERRLPDGPPQSLGTGFLVGPQAVLTNYHVVASMIDGSLPPDVVGVRFDYRQAADGTTVKPGRWVALATDRFANGVIDYSPFSPNDLVANPKPAPPGPEELDYALLYLAEALGDEPLATTPSPADPPRGWVALSSAAQVPPANGPLCILQHPQGQPLKLAIDRVISIIDQGRRLLYSTNTLPGSSGSPCFDINWNLVALHHSGDPRERIGQTPTSNQGIPIGLIDGLLRQRGFAAFLSATEI